MITPKYRDLVAGLLFVALALVIIFIAIPLGVQEPKKVKFVALSPSYYPRLVCLCLLAFGVFLIVTRLISKSRLVESFESPYKPQWGWILGGLFVLLLSYYWFLESLGFVITSTIVLAILMRLAGEKNLLALTIIPLMTPLALYAFFTKVANIPIPSGILQPLLVGS